MPTDEALRARVEANLRGFRRQRHRDAGLRAAAVAVVLLEDEDAPPSFVITRRARRLRNHGGQWALPGGRLDPGEGPEEAALRELREEVGLALEADHVLGLLDDYPTRSGFVISPVVVWGGAGRTLRPDPREVASAHRVPLQTLAQPGVPRLRRIPESDRPVISIPMLGTHVHAPTAAILYQLHEVALAGRATRGAHFDQPPFAWR